MNSVSYMLNKVNEWNDPSHSALTRHVGTRATNLFITTPVEALAVAQNVLLIAPFQAVSMTLKVGARVIQVITGSEAVKNFADNRPGLSDLMRTVARTFAYAIGTLLSATLGVLSPTTNYRVQQALGPVFAKIEARAEEAVVDVEAKVVAGAGAAADVISEGAAKVGAAVEKGAEKVADAVVSAEQAAVHAAGVVLDDANALAAKAAEDAEAIEDEVEAVVEEIDSKPGYTFSGAVAGVTSMATAPFRAFARLVGVSAS